MSPSAGHPRRRSALERLDAPSEQDRIAQERRRRAAGCCLACGRPERAELVPGGANLYCDHCRVHRLVRPGTRAFRIARDRAASGGWT